MLIWYDTFIVYTNFSKTIVLTVSYEIFRIQEMLPTLLELFWKFKVIVHCLDILCKKLYKNIVNSCNIYFITLSLTLKTIQIL